MMFAVSTDEEYYRGHYDTIEDAIAEAIADGLESFWVGKCVPPTQPEMWWSAEDWLEHVSVQDDYCGEWAANWDDSTKEQRAELETEVRAAMAAWLDKYNLRPRFFNIVEANHYIVHDGQAEISSGTGK